MLGRLFLDERDSHLSTALCRALIIQLVCTLKRLRLTLSKIQCAK